MQDADITIINGVEYEYSEFYGRLQRVGSAGSRSYPAVACPICKGFLFSLVYGDYELIADCPCGNSFTVYDG